MIESHKKKVALNCLLYYNNSLHKEVKDMELQKQNEAIFNLTQSCVHELKSKYPNNSLSQIANKIGISQATFSRIANGNIKNPNFNNVIKLLSGLDKISISEYRKAVLRLVP